MWQKMMAGSGVLLAVSAFLLLGWGERWWPAQVTVRWTTASEVNTAGFYLERAEQAEGPFERITPTLIPAQGSELVGAAYAFEDRGVRSGQVYVYRLVEVTLQGDRLPQGTVQVRASGGRRVVWPAAGLLLLAALTVFWSGRRQSLRERQP